MFEIRKAYYLCFAAIIMVCATCFQESAIREDSGCDTDNLGTEVLRDWYRHAMLAERLSEGYRAPVVSRMYAYLGIAIFESSYPYTLALDGHINMSGFRKPHSPDSAVHLPAVLNACVNRLMERFFVGSVYSVEQHRQETNRKWTAAIEHCISPEIIQRSSEWGIAVADAVYEWSAADSLGHFANLHNYDRAYHIPDGPGKWRPSVSLPMPPLLPYWHKVRTFATGPEDLEVASPLPYSEVQGSPYYNQVYEVYALSRPLSFENTWIAEFWSDDLPGLTFSPPSRWISVAQQVIDAEKPGLATVLETYLKCGIALSDVMVITWDAKYRFQVQRPEDYIRRLIDPGWQPLHPSPSFPSYPSGHAALGAAACQILTAMYGRDYRFTDRSHEGRQEFRSSPRSFSSFDAMAKENAFSRLALGVHIRSDSEEGLRLGRLVGEQVAAITFDLEWQADFSAMH